MPTPEFSKQITAIFNNSRLKESLKYDMACRLVCESLKTTTVSIFVYESRIDELICKGSYIRPSNEVSISSNIQSELINNISLFEYFDSNDIDELTLTQFNALEYLLKKDSALSLEKFELLKDKWDNDDLKKRYNKYKDAIHNERHAINEKSLTGSYFSALLKLNKKVILPYPLIKMKDGPQNGKSFFATWESLNIQIDPTELYYIAMPIFSNERYTGIIRISLFNNNSSTISEIFHKLKFEQDIPVDENSTEYIKYKFQEQRLNHFSQIVSLHIETDFYLAGYRMLNNLKIDSNNNLHIDREEIDEVCNVIAKVINSYGCVIRYDEFNRRNSPSIRGASDNLKTYFNFIKNYHSPDFSDDITNVLRTVKYGSFRVKALNFSIENHQTSDEFLVNEYYYENETEADNESVLRYAHNIKRQFRDFTPEYIRTLKDLKMREIVVLPLEFLGNAFLILANTENRKFVASDIEMILLTTKRIGLEIKYLSDREQINNIVTEENSKVIVHQIYSPIVTLGKHLENLSSGRIAAEFIQDRIDKAYHTYNNALRQLTTVQKYLEWETKGIVVKKNPLRLTEFLIGKANQFKYLAEERKLKIWVFPPENNYSNIINTDAALLGEILNCLFDNAIKYSFSQSDRFRKGIPIDLNDPRTEGHIHVTIISTPKTVSICISNHGSTIKPEEEKKIFTKGIRGQNAKKFSRIGQGIGLYIVNKIVSALNGEITANSINFQTIFKLTLPNE